MTDARKAMLLTAGLVGVCALLIMLASRIAADRPDTQLTGTAPRSTLEADYAVDVGARTIAPLGPEILAAASEDRQALGMSNLGFSAPPRLGDAPVLNATGPANDPDEQPAGLPAPPAAPAEGEVELPARGSSMATLPIIGAVVVVAAAGWGAYYVLRPAKD